MSENTRNYYEGMFVTRSGGGEDAWEQSRTSVTDILENHGATVDYVENWADQEFEIEIEKERRGKYVLVFFQVDPSSIHEIKQDTDLEDRILRELILNQNKEETYRELIQKRIEAQKEDEEDEEEEEEDDEEDEGDEAPEADAEDQDEEETVEKNGDEETDEAVGASDDTEASGEDEDEGEGEDDHEEEASEDADGTGGEEPPEADEASPGEETETIEQDDEAAEPEEQKTGAGVDDA